MRHKILLKDDTFSRGQGEIKIDPEAVEFPEAASPVAWNYNWDARPIAKATDFQVEDGEITAEIEWLDSHVTDEFVEEMSMRFGGYYNQIEERGLTVTKCTLRGVGLFLKPDAAGFPKMSGGSL